MIKKRGATFTLVAALAAIGACQSNGDDSGGDANGGGGSTNGGVGGAGASGHGGAGQTLAGSGGTSVGAAGSSGASVGGAGGKPSTGGGAGGLAGSAATNAGAGGTTNAAGSGEGGTDDGAAGEAGGAGVAGPEYAYLSTFLGGIFAFSLDPVSGKPALLPGSPVDTTAQIYALGVDPAQRHLYVLDLLHKLDVFAINADGTLPPTPASSTPIEGGPVTLALDPKGRFAYVGTRTDDPKTLIRTFKIDANSGALTSAGDPLHLDGAPAYVAVDPSGHFAYVTESTGFGIWGYSIDQTTGSLSQIGSLPFGDNAVFGGAIAFRPDGKFLYTTGNGLNGFAIDGASGALNRIGTAPFNANVSSDPTATNIAIDPRGKFLYGAQFAGGSRVFGFSIDGPSGALTAAGTPLTLSMPYSVGVEPSGRFVYVGRDDGKLSVLAVNRSNGSLREIDGSPIERGGLQPEIAFAVGR